ncbi:hypothetical protein D3C71_1236950 [compost metagenome]
MLLQYEIIGYDDNSYDIVKKRLFNRVQVGSIKIVGRKVKGKLYCKTLSEYHKLLKLINKEIICLDNYGLNITRVVLKE